MKSNESPKWWSTTPTLSVTHPLTWRGAGEVDLPRVANAAFRFADITTRSTTHGVVVVYRSSVVTIAGNHIFFSGYCMNSNGYTKVPQHMRAEVKRVIEMHRGRRVPLRRQTLSALKRGHFHAEHGPLDLDFERQFKWMVDEEMYSQDFKKKLRTVIPKQKEIEKKVIQLVLKTYRNFERRYLQSTAKSNSNNAIANSNLNARWKNEFRFDSLEAFSRYNKLEALIDPGSDTLERYRDQLLAKEIIKALGIRTSELRPNMRNDGYSLATTKAYITHKNPLNRPDSNNQTLVREKG